MTANLKTMKKQLSAILFGLCLLAMGTACDKVLDRQKPQNEVGDEFSINSIKGGQAAMHGLYHELQSGNYYGSNFMIISDVSSDQGQSIGTWDFYREMDTYEVTLGNTENSNFYARAYRAINLANHIIQKVPALSDGTEAQKNRVIGNAHFVRALAYFDLVRVYGGVPNQYGNLGMGLVTAPFAGLTDASFVSRSSLTATYEMIEDDLLLAEGMLSPSTDRSLASKGAAWALLARLYLYMGNWSQAEEYASRVMNDNTYTLLPNFLEIFEGKLTSESILELAFNSADQSSMRSWYLPTTRGGRGDLAVHSSFAQLATADPNDIRGKQYVFEPVAGIYYPAKYSKAGNIDNFHILRVAEMYLTRAEARAQMNNLAGALADLNAVRARAGVAPSSASGQAALLDAILHERNLELAFEGHRFFDLVRTGKAMSVLVNVERKNGPPVTLKEAGRQVLPIPQFDTDANPNIEQNEAYR